MNKATKSLLANILHAIQNRQTATIGGGRFSPDELKAAYPSLVIAAKVGDDTRALISELATAMKHGARWVEKGIADNAFAGCVLPKAAEQDCGRMYAAIDAAKAALMTPPAPDPRDALIAELVAALNSGADALDEALQVHIYCAENGEKPGDDCRYVATIAGMRAALAKAAALTLARPAVTIRVTVEGGVVQSIESDGSADVTAILLDFDTDGCDPTADDIREIDGDLCSAVIYPVDYLGRDFPLPDDMARPDAGKMGARRLFARDIVLIKPGSGPGSYDPPSRSQDSDFPAVLRVRNADDGEG